MRYIVLVLLVLTSCEFMTTGSPDSRFTGEWELEVRYGDLKSSSTTYVFNDSNFLEVERYSNDYYYIIAGTYSESYYLWSVSGNTLTLKDCDSYGFKTKGEKTVTFQFSDNKLILDGMEYIKK